jgi:hypothetical protein
MKLTGENRQLGEQLVPVLLCPPQISHGLTRDRTRASAVDFSVKASNIRRKILLVYSFYARDKYLMEITYSLMKIMCYIESVLLGSSAVIFFKYCLSDADFIS